MRSSKGQVIIGDVKYQREIEKYLGLKGSSE